MARSAVLALLLILPASGSAAANGETTGVATAAAWLWPLDEPHPIVRPFEAPETPYSAGHRGIDISGQIGSVVRAPANGIIHFSGFIVNRYVVSLDHGGGVLSSFEPVHSELAAGTLVRRGQPIGTLQSGHCRVPCLHLGARVYGHYVSPLNFLGGIPRSVLLPTRDFR